MSSITLDVPDELAERLRELLATLPAPEEVLALRASPRLQERIRELLEKSLRSSLSPEEELEWERIEYDEHLVRVAKAKAAVKLKDK